MKNLSTFSTRLSMALPFNRRSVTPSLREVARIRTPPQFSIPLQACCFGFIVRHIGGTRQLPRADPVLPNQQRPQTDIPGPDQIGVQRELTLLADKEQPMVRAVGATGKPTAWTALTGVIRIDADAAASNQCRFIREQPAQFRKRPPRGVVVGPSLLFA